MSSEHSEPTDPQPDEPIIEDASESEHVGEDKDEALEDNPEDVRLDVAAREMDSTDAGDAKTDEPRKRTRKRITEGEAEGAGDTDSIQEGPEDLLTRDPSVTQPDWGNVTSAHRIAVELKRVEGRVRELLEGRDGRRKRRLTGTRRWLDLQEDIISWRGGNRIDDESLNTLEQLVARRQYLFRRLHFLAGTRSGWNT